jgi:ABC-2 type transport system ATP-binding protein
MPQPAIELRNLGRRFGERWVIRNMDLDVPEGLVCGLLGRRGVGKTTTLRTIFGLLQPHEGEVRVKGLDPLRDRAAVVRAMGYAGEEPSPDMSWSVERVLAFSSWVYGDWDADRAEALRRRFALPLDRRVGELSAASRSSLVLIVALVRRPGVLLLDEPFGTVDDVVRRETVERMIEVLPRAGSTVLLSSHRIQDLERIVGRIAILRGGKIVFNGSVEKLRDAVRRVRIVSDDGALDPRELPCVRNADRLGRGWCVSVVDFTEDRLDALKTAGFSIEAVEKPGLEQIAFEYTEDDHEEGLSLAAGCETTFAPPARAANRPSRIHRLTPGFLRGRGARSLQ